MASILDRYGIKEVADVTFYKIDENGNPDVPVLFLDTLKVSTIEQTAETADARGGKGNPKLITWDYGKEITVTIEDALFSPKSMAIMLGDGVVTRNANSTTYMRKTGIVRLDSTTGKAVKDFILVDVYDTVQKTTVRKKVYIGSGSVAPAGEILPAQANIFFKDQGSSGNDGKSYSEAGVTIDSAFTLSDLQALYVTGDSSRKGEKVFFDYWVPAKTNTIIVSADTFPGTYYVTGDTYARSDIDGHDQLFQFVIPKAKMTSEQTITLEAEGDPSTFSMTLTVLRPESGDMMQLIQYDLEGVSASD